MMDRLQEIEQRLSVIKTEIDSPEANLDALETEINELTEERKGVLDKVEKRKNLVNGIVNLPKENVIKEFIPESEERNMEFTKENVLKSAEYRSGLFQDFTRQGIKRG